MAYTVWAALRRISAGSNPAFREPVHNTSISAIMRKLEAIANFAMFVLPLVVGLLLVLAFSMVQQRGAVFFVCLAVYAIGLCLLLAAELSLFRQGIMCSFGPSKMSPTNQRRYGAGYTFIMVGMGLNLLLLLSTVIPG